MIINMNMTVRYISSDEYKFNKIESLAALQGIFFDQNENKV